MELCNNKMLLMAIAAFSLYFFIKYKDCSKKENFGRVGREKFDSCNENCKIKKKKKWVKRYKKCMKVKCIKICNKKDQGKKETCKKKCNKHKDISKRCHELSKPSVNCQDTCAKECGADVSKINTCFNQCTNPNNSMTWQHKLKCIDTCKYINCKK